MDADKHREKTTEMERRWIRAIANRYTSGRRNRMNGRIRDVLLMAHESEPLDLEGLLNAPVFDFIHDVEGILENYDPAAGEYKNFFSPRCRRRSRDTAEGRRG